MYSYIMLVHAPPYTSLTPPPPSRPPAPPPLLHPNTAPRFPCWQKLLSGFPQPGVGSCRPYGSSTHGGDAVLGQDVDCEESVPVAEPISARRGHDSAGLQARNIMFYMYSLYTWYIYDVSLGDVVSLKPRGCVTGLKRGTTLL